MEKPHILIEDRDKPGDLECLRKSGKTLAESDVYKLQLMELFEVRHPTLIGSKSFTSELEKFIHDRTKDQDKKIRGSWVFYPWSGLLVHMLLEEEYFEIRTNRNRNLVTKKEQEIIRNFNVGIVGLSVGSNVATTLAYGGAAKSMKLAEFDSLETSNLNRIRARVDQIGMKKIDIATQQVYEVDPYADVHIMSQKLDKKSLEKFMTQDPKPQLIFEIIDSFEVKIYLRLLAKKLGIPVVMVTNLGDRILMDVERYDLDPSTEFFNGRAGNVPEEILKHPDVTSEDQHKYAVELAGVEHIPQKALDSVKEIGKTLVGRPQFGSSVTIASGFSSYFVRKIALGDTSLKGSWLVDLDKLFISKNSL